MKEHNVKTVFTNILFIIGVILAIFGFIQGSLTLARSLIFDKYPLQSYEETRCQQEYESLAMIQESEKDDVSNKTVNIDAEGRRMMCEESVDNARNVKQVEHIVSSFATLVASAVLILSFKRFIF